MSALSSSLLRFSLACRACMFQTPYHQNAEVLSGSSPPSTCPPRTACHCTPYRYELSQNGLFSCPEASASSESLFRSYSPPMPCRSARGHCDRCQPCYSRAGEPSLQLQGLRAGSYNSGAHCSFGQYRGATSLLRLPALFPDGRRPDERLLHLLLPDPAQPPPLAHCRSG